MDLSASMWWHIPLWATSKFVSMTMPHHKLNCVKVLSQYGYWEATILSV